MNLRLPVLNDDPAAPFPPAADALREPDGLLAVGGDLSPRRLLNAYAHGVFPWFSEGQPILWWTPDPRTLFRTDGMRLSSRARRQWRRGGWRVVADRDFEAVIRACATAPRRGQDGTWIGDDMIAAYCELHRLGHAHSIEVRAGDEPDAGRLVGGLYGVAIGRMFFGESMFSARSGASKAALAGLAHRLREWGWPLVDAQVGNPHLATLGAEAWPRTRFLEAIAGLCAQPVPPGSWAESFGTLPAPAPA
jgi:leucyl/phenylalanyl-tRNA--protein transferase